MNPTIRIVGIDPALRNTGLALAEVDIVTLEWKVIDLHLIQTQPLSAESKKVIRKSSGYLQSTQKLHRELHEFLRDHKASMAAAEIPSGAQSASASLSNGVCLGLLGSITIPLIEVNPTEVKLASVGHKYGAKEEIIEWAVARHPSLPWLRRKVKGELRLMNDNEHLADACSVIPAAIKSPIFQQAVMLMRSAMLQAA